MGKKKKNKKLKKERIKVLETLTKVKSKCCKKYKKAENRRCKKCPCFDLLKKVA
jgi:hypothetical protein